MLPPRFRWLVAIAAATLGAVYFLPLWRITLTAPQYPEGIGMLIWTHTITGVEPHHLQNINGLNHYIGMKPIEADSIPELRIMPWVLAGLIAWGLGAAAVGRRGLVRTWVVAFAASAALGVADFWLWQYDYGHNLDAEAAIKIPGMNYQPPLFGSKQLLNFSATSWPAAGGWIAFASLALAGGVLVADARQRRRRAPALVTGAALAAAACFPAGPRALVPGEDTCGYCRMVISDPRFGAQAIAPTGKVQTFDSVECLAGYAASLGDDSTSVRLFVSDYDAPGSWIRAEDAIYIVGGSLASPMGRRVAAFRAHADTASLWRRFGGSVMDWPNARAAVSASRAHDHTAHEHAKHDPSEPEGARW